MVEQEQLIESDGSHAVELNGMIMTMPFFDEMVSTAESIEQIKLYTRYPMRYNYQIRKISRMMYSQQGLYANVVDYMVAMPNLNFIVNSIDTVSDKKRKLFSRILKKINHKFTTRDILRSLLIDGIYVGVLRNTKATNPNLDIQAGIVDSLQLLEGLATDDSLMIQPLYVDYIKILGFQNNDYVVGFDMQYFDAFVGNGLLGEIKNFPQEFAKAYVDYKKDGSKRYFKLDQSKTVVLKLKSNILEPWGRPLCISSLDDMFFSKQYTDSQRENISEIASAIRWLKQPESEDKGKCSLTKEQQANQYDNFKKAVFSNRSDNSMARTTTLVLAPGTEVGKLEVNSDLLKDTLTNENITKTSTDLGFASAALNGAGEGGASYASLQVNISLVLTQVFEILEQVSFQYNKILNNFAFGDNKNKECMEMTYLRTSDLTKETDVVNAKELYTLGGGSRLYWIACASGDMDSYLSLMEYEREMNFDEKFPPHQTAYTNNGEGGAPTNNNPTNENTIKSKTNGSDKTPKPS